MTLLEMKMLSNGLKRNKNLKSLSLVGCGLGNSSRIVTEFIDGFAKNASLTSIDLSGNYLNDD